MGFVILPGKSFYSGRSSWRKKCEKTSLWFLVPREREWKTKESSGPLALLLNSLSFLSCLSLSLSSSLQPDFVERERKGGREIKNGGTKAAK
jgi:hypothetical protein